jgi:hypothetical protein
MLSPKPTALVIPLTPGRAATVELPAKFTEADWLRFKAVMDAMLPGIVLDVVDERVTAAEEPK